MDEQEFLSQFTPEEIEAFRQQNACTPDKCSTCGAACPSAAETQVPKPAKRVLAVSGGKGGAGATTITVMLASALAKRGLKVGILDADVYGGAIPHVLGITEPITSADELFVPARTSGGLSVVSMTMMMQEPGEPVLYPAADAAKIAAYFWTGTAWGELDILLIDMPSGGGDTPLEFYTTLALDGVLAVVNPGELAALAAGRAIRTASMLGVPVLGMIENFADMRAGDGLSERYDRLPVMARVEEDSAIRAAGDAGELEGVSQASLDMLARAIGTELAQGR